MSGEQQQILAMVLAVSFAAGLNVYAAVAALGLLARAEVLALPAGLAVLENWWVIGAALALFLVEFLADKVPGFDLVWNALQTFVRVPAGAVLAFAATADFEAATQVMAAISGGGLAFAAHGGKTAVRAAVTPSPEPFSNIGLSLVEDVIAVGLIWFAVEHPYWAAAIVLIMLLAVVLLIRWVLRALRRLLGGLNPRTAEPPAR